jgi:putative FmdB family regulatory protein
MPIYEYQCTGCGHQLEVMQKMSDKPLSDCPECHQPALTKLVSSAGFQLKGSGWYLTDYSTKGKPKSANETGNTSDTKSEKESKTAETKSNDTGSKKETSTDKKSSTDSGATK